jgi:hypothetical protein
MVEQDSSEWWQATQEAARACLRKVDVAVAEFDPSVIKAVAVTGQMQNVVPLPKVRLNLPYFPPNFPSHFQTCSELPPLAWFSSRHMYVKIPQ